MPSAATSVAIQFFLPGVPQVYYVGLLAGENDMTLLRRTGVGRDINRHRYDAAEVDLALTKTVVRDLIDLIRKRNAHPAFGGRFTLEADDNEQRLSMKWNLGDHTARLSVDFATLSHEIYLST